MPRSWNSLITVLSEITSKNCDSIVFCSHCGNCHTYVKWGFYRRYLFDGELTNIQRYRCYNDKCPCRTFSILPHAFLRLVRASLCMLMYVLKMYEQGNSIASIARQTNSNWPKPQRWIAKASAVQEWLRQESAIGSWGLSPCFSPDKSWTSFTRDFSWAFYPNRLG